MGSETERGNPVGGADDTSFSIAVMGAPNRVSIVSVSGQADLHTASDLRTAITEAIDGGAASLVVDLSEATFIDSMTLGVLLGAVKRLRPAGGGVGIVTADSHIRRIFEITLLDRVFTLHDDREAALEHAGGGE